MDATLPNFLRQQGYALCEYLGAGEFLLLAEPPPWFAEIWKLPAETGKSLRLGEVSAFLKSFLADAETFWNSQAAEELASGDWIESTCERREVPLQAVALRVAGKRVLAIQSRATAFEERTRVLQTARDGLLVHERLLKEIQKKEILLHCIVHDLSQPLTAMRGCFECLALEGGSARAKQLVDVGKQQSEQQEEMIREVLKAFSADLQDAMQSGESARELPDILRCASETVEAFTPVFRSKGLIIRLDPRLQGHAAWRVMGEHTRLKRIFSNLVENALRYAPSGSIVTLGVEDDEPYVKAFVEDQGPGLPKDFLESRAFKLFSKGKEGGGKAGLGLYFCRITVERWGGTMGCEDVVPHGSRFWFRLLAAKEQLRPVQRGKDAPQSAAANSVAPGGAQKSPESANAEIVSTSAVAVRPARRSGLRILLADDDPAIRELTELLLARQGYKVVAVSNGLEVLRVLSSRRFDIVLLDDEMPKLGGAQTARRIREEEKQTGKHQFLLSLSGNTGPSDTQRLQDAGMDGCLSKPFHAEELNRALEGFAVPATNPPAPAVVKDANSGEAELLARLGGDHKLLVRLIHTFLKDYPKKVAVLRAAVSGKDAAAVAAAAHALKGSISIFGAAQAKQYAQELQDGGRSGQLDGAAKTLARLEEEIAKVENKLRGYTTRVGGAKSGFGESKPRGRAKKKRAKR
jgi:signal transduction histidine kinase/CheY-like chemotaxis protein